MNRARSPVSVLDELRAVEERILARLGELQPAVSEYEELQQAAERLGIDTSSVARTSVTEHLTPATARRPGGTRAAGAERRQRVLALISDRPGITVSELSAALHVDPPPLYRVVRRLQAEGVVNKVGKHLHLA